MDSRLFCCVDGGASHTRVALYDGAGQRLGLSVGGPTSLTIRGAGAWQEILAVLENLARAVSLEVGDLTGIHFGIGLAGANNSAQRDLFKAAAPAVGGLRVSTDAYIGLGRPWWRTWCHCDCGDGQRWISDRGGGSLPSGRGLGLSGWR